MFARIRRKAFDSTPDSIMAAVSFVGAPMTQEPSGLLLKVVSVSGGQLTELENKLRQFAHSDLTLAASTEVRQLLEELGRCSHLYIISTSIELVLVSDRSRRQYEQIEAMNLELMPKFDAFRDECTRFIQRLQHLEA